MYGRPGDAQPRFEQGKITDRGMLEARHGLRRKRHAARAGSIGNTKAKLYPAKREPTRRDISQPPSGIIVEPGRKYNVTLLPVQRLSQYQPLKQCASGRTGV